MANESKSDVEEFEQEEVERIGALWETNLQKVFQSTNAGSNMKELLVLGKIKALLVFGEDPLISSDNLKYFKGLEFLLVQDITRTYTAREADVVLPAATRTSAILPTRRPDHPRVGPGRFGLPGPYAGVAFSRRPPWRRHRRTCRSRPVSTSTS